MLPFKFNSLLIIFSFSLSIQTTYAQSRTDPKEAKAINTILGRWGKPASSAWNISGDPCSGAAIDITDFDKTTINPIIKCDCAPNTNTTCHITKLKVYALNVVGTIPEELQDLPFLNNLNIAQNYLTGPFPSFMGNLTKMQYLTFGINALSGTIPAELGNLHNLVSLGMGTNNFSGPLPSELGNLNNLEQLYMDSCGLSGELPSTMSKLKKMQTLWASDNNFTGTIPDYLGNFPNLASLRFQGNSFVGPIPSSLSKLVGMADLRIGDIVNGTSSLSFISEMTSLNILILRNAKISGTIPSNFSPFKKLMKLDLSFNNITGVLPRSLFNLSSLAYLFLGNNSLSGNLPILKSSSIANLDLSYNQLSGSFPAWVSEKNLKLNLVANNFVIDDSSSKVLPSGLSCLQRSIPCNRGSPIYSDFAIKCGGNKLITDSNGVVYDIDNAVLRTASYYVNDQTKWGVNSVGNFAEDTTGANYIISSTSQFLNTLDSELFQTARMSPSSLRYFRLGLENGNYSIELQFSEIAFPNSPTWQSTGKRVFDILIQGNLAEKDFNIEKAAGGRPFRAVMKKYIAPVTNNFLEIHFFWAGKGTCCVPTQGYYGPSISAISVSPYDFTPNSKSKNTGVIVGVVVAIVILGFLAAVGFFIFKKKQRKKRLGEEDE